MKIPQLHVGAGTAAGPLTIFPVWTSGRGRLGISTGLHADLAVSELAAGARVGQLTVRNNGKRAALLLEGELLEGGQQHRTCARDVLVGPGEALDIDAFCVEAGRWQAGQSLHRRQARRAPLNVRAELARAGSGTGRDSQSRIWERVRRFDAVRGPSATSSLPEHLDRFVDGVLHHPARTFPAPLEGQRGVVIGIGGQPLLLEVFATAALFQGHYRQLIEAVLLDAELLPPSARNAAPMPGQAARDFAAIAGTIDFGDFYSPGVGRHDPMHSRTISGKRGPVTGVGIAVARPDKDPDVVHVNYWNTTHPLMEAL
ncbi:hypothetical protein GD627_11875 [Arthrobacter yangruifuii]|uniref:ARG and Rhodanese-Phosphatase-superfamily-associated domain-containing protein n=1 Tax=Arthrobacter yangruifuii TaxID=2606616 RepID=A0A5N6MEW1_9MICC|nr:DUF6569 family protein [Arthrobacter yangruifuii]KAD3515002.1 hypothetical protein GD627_11875 [Arthrobacter yangruifuii]